MNPSRIALNQHTATHRIFLEVCSVSILTSCRQLRSSESRGPAVEGTSSHRACVPPSLSAPRPNLRATGIMLPMTLVEITFELQSPITDAQLRHLSEFANTYGLRRFHLDETKNFISFEYDASRLRQTQVAAALAGANVAVKRIVPQHGNEIIPA